MKRIPESEFEYHRAYGERSGYPPCCIEAFLQGRGGLDVFKEYSMDWNDQDREKKIFGKVLSYVPCKDCCKKLAAGESE